MKDLKVRNESSRLRKSKNSSGAIYLVLAVALVIVGAVLKSGLASAVATLSDSIVDRTGSLSIASQKSLPDL